MYDDNAEWVVCANQTCENLFEKFPINKKYCSLRCKNEARRITESEIYDDTLHTPYEKATGFKLYEPVTTYDLYSDSNVQSKNEFLRKENSRLKNLVDKHKNVADELYHAILQEVKNNVKSIDVKPYKDSGKASTKAPSLIFNPWNSDLQLGKTTPTYNTQVAYDRVELYTDYILEHYKDYANEYKLPAVNVYFLGDIVEGEGIYPTQPHQIDSSVFRQATVDAPQIYGAQIRRLAEVFETVNVVAVIGNHGRLSRYANPESNMDRVFYQTLYWMFAENPRINITIPQGHGENMFYAVDKIGNYSTLLIHGDQMGAPGTQTTYRTKVLG